MKYLVLIALLKFNVCYSQCKISKVSANRDTLWLLNDETGKLIAKSWDIQSDTYPRPVIVFVENFDTANYYYRFSIEAVESRNFAKEITSDLTEIFKVEPVFYEEIKQFQVLSNIEIDQRALAIILSKKVSYFKCSAQ